VRKAVAALLCLLCRTVPLASSEVVFERTYVVPRPFGGLETIKVTLTVANEPVVVRPDTVAPTRIRIFTKTSTELTISKFEESGGYAHGIDWWVNGVNQDRLLYAFSKNGSADLGSFSSGTVIELRLYRIDVFFYEAIDPLYRIDTVRDASGPSFVLSPVPGAYPLVVVTVEPTDAGAGMGADPALATTYSVTRASTGEPTSTSRGTSVALGEEGDWNVSFSAIDLLGNVGSCPAGTGPPNTYTVDRSPPVLTGLTPALLPKRDGDLEFNLSFGVSDVGAGVSIESLLVRVACVVDGLMQWEREYGDTELQLDEVVDGFTAQVPALVVPRSSLLFVQLGVTDEIGNALAPEAGALTIATPPAALHASVRVSDVVAEAVPSGSLLIARYQVPVDLDRPREALRSQGVARYRVTRTFQASGEVETVVDLPPTAFAARLVDREGLAVFTDVMEGSRYAHQTFTYGIETVFAVDGAESVIADGVAILPNIEAWQVRVTAGEKLLQQYGSYDLSFPEIRVRTLVNMTASIGPDPEDDELGMRVEMSGPDGSSGSWPVAGWARAIVFADVLPGASDGVYKARFLVSEAGNDHQVASPWITIGVDPNYGEIEGDETWSTDQVMTGSILIHPGARLTLSPGVRVTVARAIDLATGEGLSITVRSGGSIVLSPGSVVQPVGWRADTQAGEGWDYWAGILVEGTATIGGGAIRGALRGVAAMPGSDVTLQDARIEGCRTGVHAFGDGVGPAIEATRFVGCVRYGIKEDAGAVPVVTDCTFERNASDYYDTELTVVAAEDIDVLEPGGNRGNRSAGGTP
jgi:hypothetical protein